MNIVVVSDEPVLVALVRRPLEPLGYRVAVVASAAALRPRRDELAPRAALLPRRLPDADLAAVVAELRAAPIPIATVVVGVAVRDRAAAHAADADGFLLAPFTDAQ